MESPAAAARPAAELIVLNGRLKGSRRALVGPLTLFGQDPACEFRLNLDGIASLHAALVTGPAGPVVRDLSQLGSVLVNGVGTDNTLLRDGDILTVGPFQFQLSLPEAPDPDGLRIQAAAVAAEQVRLTEVEGKLEQRRLALETQEKQLLDHLEEKRAKLEAFQQQVKGEREAWREQRETEENQLAEYRTLLATQGEEFEAQVRQRQLLDERHDREARAREECVDRRERDLDAQTQELERQRAAQTQEREAVERMRLRVNGDLELGKRQMQEQRETLHLAQQAWEVVLNEEEQVRQRNDRALQERETALESARANLAARRQQWRNEIVGLQKEATGLESRIRGQRERLLAVERELAQRGFPIYLAAPPVPVAVPLADPAAPAELRQLEAQLADQRIHLAEQWQRLVDQQQRWEDDRNALLRNLEEAALGLAGREKNLAAQESEQTDRSAALVRLEQALEERQTLLEGHESRLRVQGLDQSAQHARILAEVAVREQSAMQRVQGIEGASQRQRQRCRRLLRKLARARKQLEALHVQYAALWRDKEEARRTVLLTGQELARQRLALEKLRHDLLDRAANTPVAERRLARLEAEYTALWTREEADLKIEWKSLDRERALLDTLAQQGLAKLAAGVANLRRAEQLRTRRAERKAQRACLEAEAAARTRHLEAERALAENTAELLRAELERIVLNLMGETAASATASVENRAA